MTQSEAKRTDPCRRSVRVLENSRSPVVWRASGGVGWTKIVFWRLQEALDHQKYCHGGPQKARVEKTSVLEVSRRRWIDKNSVLAAAGRLSIWRQVRTARTAAGGGKPPKQLFQRFSVFNYSIFSILNVECIVTIYTPRGSRPRRII